MRADIASPCDPSLPSGYPHTPGSPSPLLTRRRKQSSHRIRHLGGTAGGQAAGMHVGGPGGISAHSQHLAHQGLPASSLMAVGDPQTLQEKKELLEYFQKLRVLVPSLPKTGKIPKLDVIEHVITYIKQLESQLIDHPMIQVLENNAYISGLLQSMAPEFDISHLFPARAAIPHQHQHQHSAGSQHHFSSDSDLLSQSSSYQYSGQASAPQSSSTSSSSSSSSSPRSKLKSRKSTVRKPFSILSSTNATQ